MKSVLPLIVHSTLFLTAGGIFISKYLEAATKQKTAFKPRNKKGETMTFSASQIKNSARGNWGLIFNALAPQLNEAMEHAGKHCSCPVHGGTNGFRLFKDFEQSGGCVCNSCGTFSDGLATLGFVNGWDFPTAVAKVAEFLGFDDKAEGKVILFDTDKQFRTVGSVLDFGEAPYEFVEGRGKAFYVRMNTEDGQTLAFWGNGLRSAFNRSHAKAGEWIECAKIGYRQAETKNGKPFKSPVWTVTITQSPEDRQAETAKTLILDQKKEERIDSTWKMAKKLSDDSVGAKAVVTYLRNRGVTISVKKLEAEDCIRAIDKMPYYEGKEKKGDYPAMVSAVRDCFGVLKTLHITYLLPEGVKAPVTIPKKILSMPSKESMSGCSIPLTKAGKMLAVAEGVETALSVSTGLRLPCWATISANGMRSLRIPNHVLYVLIMADKDRSEAGYKAALELQTRLRKQGCDARIFLPDMDIPDNAKGVDWNDALLAHGKEAFVLEGVND